MKKTLLLSALLLASAAFAADYTHDEGTTEVSAVPERVVVIDEEALGWMYALGLGDKIVGFGSSYVSPATDIEGGKLKKSTAKQGFFSHGKLNEPTYIGNFTQFNFETLAALSPDLIVRTTWDGNEHYNKLSEMAPTLGYKEGSYNYWKKSLEQLGEIFGKQERAKQISELPANVNRYNKAALEAAGLFDKFDKVAVVAPFAGGSNWAYTSTRLIDDLRSLGFKDGLTLPASEVSLGVGAAVSDEALLGLDEKTLLVVFPPGGEYDGSEAFMNGPVGQKLKNQTLLYKPEQYAPYSGPLTQARNSNLVTKALLQQFK